MSGNALLRWAFAGAVVAGVTALAGAIESVAPTHAHALFAPYFPALIAIAYFAGALPAVVALASSLLAVDLLWIGAPSRLDFATVSHLSTLAVLAIAGGTVIYVAEMARRLITTLRATRERLDAAHRVTGMVEWEWELGTGRVRLSSSAAQVFGTTWDSVEGAWPLAHPDDRDRVERTIREAVEAGTDYTFVSRMIHAQSREMRWLETRAIVHRGADGRPSHVTGVTLDITDKQRALQASRDGEQRFRVALDGGSIIAWACDAERRYTWVYNPASGFAPEDFIGRKIGASGAPETFSAFLAAVDRVWATGERVRVPVEWRHGDETRHYISNIDPVKDANGTVVGLVGASVDVTPLHSARIEAQHARAELQTVVDAMHSGVCRCDRDLRYRWASRRYLELLELGPGPIVGRPLAEVLGAEAFALKRPYIERVLAGETVEFEQELPRGDGSRCWLHASYSPTRGADGGVDGWVAVLTDLSERQRIAAALRESEERLRIALEGGEIGMWTTDLGTGITECTPFNYTLFGLPPDSSGVQPRQWYESMHPDDRPLVAQAWEAARTGTKPYRVEFRIVRPDGEVRWLDSRAQFRHDGSGRPARLFGITMDVTDRKRVNEALHEANRRKDEFLATLAHELRNPLAPVRYATRIFRSDTPPELVQEAGRMIERQLAHMARLLDDLLDVSRVTRGALTLRREVLDLRQVVESSVEAARPLAESVGHRLVVRLPEHPLQVLGDATRLAQVIGNLLNNATKYTDPGGEITVSAGVDTAGVHVEVRDTGIGIPAELLPKVFELFTQGARSGESSSGLGIGLALARQLVTIQGGSLDAYSDGPGRGSRFVLRLPRVEEPRAVSAPVPAMERVAVLGAAGTRVLIVDDNVDAADSLAQVLRLSGYEPRVAYEGVTALEIAEILQPGIVLLDIGLPNISGYDVARRMRATAWGRRARIVAITGWGQEDDRRRSRDAGFDEHLTKPVDPEQLLHLLARITRALGTARASPHALESRGDVP